MFLTSLNSLIRVEDMRGAATKKWAPIQLPVRVGKKQQRTMPTSAGSALKAGKTNDTHSRTMHLITAAYN